MTDTAICVENLSKKFKIGLQQYRHDALRDLLMDALRNKKERELNSEFWALLDVSFEVKRGEVVGVIGRNGAGKSTLLKILSRITEPTSGRAVINGRVGSLLEVGTGFHPELTGRENIYLNGAILGMKREEIRRKFDEIVDFAEIEKFLDTPVKHYSSGMYVRLAFAVAAHLEPEILLVDEVLAVGDIAFQKKCLGKMGNIAEEGRTVVFVSHNISAVSYLCPRVVWLDRGAIGFDGLTEKGLSEYLASQIENAPKEQNLIDLPEDEVILLRYFDLLQDGKTGNLFDSGKDIAVRMKFRVRKRVDGLRVGFNLYFFEVGGILFRSFHDDKKVISYEIGEYNFSAVIPANFLKPGRYQCKLAVGIHNERWIINEDISRSFDLKNISGMNRHYADSRPGYVMPCLDWEGELVDE